MCTYSQTFNGLKLHVDGTIFFQQSQCFFAYSTSETKKKKKDVYIEQSVSAPENYKIAFPFSYKLFVNFLYALGSKA